MPATFNPREMLFDDFVDWATGYITFEIGAGRELHDAVRYLMDTLLQNKHLQGIDRHKIEQAEAGSKKAISHLTNMRDYAEETHVLWDKGEDSKVGKRLLAMSGRLPSYHQSIGEIHKYLEECGR